VLVVTGLNVLFLFSEAAIQQVIALVYMTSAAGWLSAKAPVSSPTYLDNQLTRRTIALRVMITTATKEPTQIMQNFYTHPSQDHQRSKRQKNKQTFISKSTNRPVTPNACVIYSFIYRHTSITSVDAVICSTTQPT